MATTNELKSFDLAGILDSCTDWVDQIVPDDTPFLNSLNKADHTSNSFSWVQDVNDTLEENIVDGALEGGDAPGTAIQDGTKSDQTERLNYAQIFRKFVTISDTAEAVAVHGRKSETEYQLEKAITSLKNQIEATFLSKQEKRKATSSLSALTDGVFAQIPTELVIEGEITAANVESITHQLYLNGSTADMIYTNSFGAKAFKALMEAQTGVGPDLKIKEVVKKEGHEYEIERFTFTDVNGRTYKVCTSRHLEKAFPTSAAAYFLNSKDFSCVVFRDIKIVRLSKTGSTSRYLVEGEYGLRHNGRYKAGVIVPKV